MANPIETAFSSGATLYAVVHHTDGRVWNNTNSAWEAYSGALWAQYAVALTEQGTSGYYRGTFPTGATDVLSTEVVYQQSGGTPALGDAPATGIGQSQGVDIAAVKTSVTAALNHKTALLGMIIATVTSSGTSTALKIYCDLADTVDAYQGRVVLFASGALIRQVGNIVSYDATGHFLTMASGFTAAPVVGTTFIIV